MSESSLQPAIRRLWRTLPLRAPAPAAPLAPPRRLRAFILLACALAVLGAWCGLLTWLRPLPQVRLVPLWTTGFQEPLVPDRPFAERDRFALVQGAYFALVGASTGRQQGFQMQEALAEAAQCPEDEPLVVYLSTFAAVGANGQLDLLPADYDVDQPHSRLPLRRVLELLRACPAERKLLVLDVMAPIADARLGILADDAAERIDAEIARVDDPRRLVLCAASPGEAALVSEDLGRTAFGFYFEEGLRGWADGFDNGRRDGRVSVRELAAFVGTRVSRWSRHCRGVGQTPRLLGTGDDFVLFAPPYARPLPRLVSLDPTADRDGDGGPGTSKGDVRHAQGNEAKSAPSVKTAEDAPITNAGSAGAQEVQKAAPEAQAAAASATADSNAASPRQEPQYPDWLHAAWKTRDEWRAAEAHRTLPRLFARLEAVLLRAEGRFRAGELADSVRDDLADRLAELRQTKNEWLLAPKPRPYSLAEFAARHSPDPAIGAALDQLVAKLNEPTGGAKPEESAKVRDEWVRGFAKQFTGLPATAYAATIAQEAVADRDPSTAEIALYDALLRARPTESTFVEPLLVRRLAQLAQRSDRTWSPSLAHRLLEATSTAERILARTDSFTWLGERLDGAMQARHDAQVALLEAPVATTVTATSRLQQAESLLATLDAQSGAVEEALRLTDEASLLLSALERFVPTEPVALDTWQTAADACRQVWDLLDRSERAPAQSDDALRDEIARLIRESGRLRAAAADLRQRYSPATLDRAIARARDDVLKPQAVRELESLLATPVAPADLRAAAWKSLRQLEYQLNQAVFRLDADENDWRHSSTAAGESKLVPAPPGTESAARRVRVSLDLLRMVGYPADRLALLESAFVAAAAPEASDEARHTLAQALAEAWNSGLNAALASSIDLRRRDRLARLAAPQVVSRILDDASQNPTVRLRQQRTRDRSSWLADWFAYVAREPGPGELYTQLAREYGISGADLLTTPADLAVQLDAAAGRTSTAIPGRARITLRVPAERQLALSFDVVAPDGDWIRLTPDRVAFAALTKVTKGPAVRTAEVPFRLELRPESAPRRTGAAGVLFRLAVDGRSFHRVVPLPGERLPKLANVDVLFGFDPNAATDFQSSIRLRPTGAPTPVWMYLRNRTAEPRSLTVSLATAAGPMRLVTAPISLGANEIRRIDWKPGPPATGAAAPSPPAGAAPPPTASATTSLPQFTGPLLVTLSDETGARSTTQVEVAIADPREYVEVASVLFEPPKSSLPNRFRVILRHRGAASGLPIAAELELPPARIPGLIAVKEGTLRGTMSATATELELSARDLVFQTGTDENGYCAVHVDGFRRAFTFRTTFARAGDPTTPQEDTAPAVRLLTPTSAVSGPKFGVTVEVDNAPADARLEISLSADGPEKDVIQHLPGGRRYAIACDSKDKDGALVFVASVADWQTTLDTTGIHGRRLLAATLHDPRTGPVATATQEVFLDPLPPTNPRFLTTPGKVRAGGTLEVRAAAEPGVTPIAAAVFFVGKPADGKIPPGAASVPGHSVDDRQTVWAATLTIPEQPKGPLDIGVQFVNRAGLSDVATTSVTVVDRDAPTGLGTIVGKVLEGDRAQPNLDVLLADEKGADLAKVKTKADGSFRFDGLKPGKYLLKTSKPQSRRVGQAPVVVEPDRTAQINLPLYVAR